MEGDLSEETIKKQTNIPTDTNLKPVDARMKLGAYSLPSLATYQGRIYEEARKELRFPECIRLYKQMMLYPSIASATALIEMLIGKVEWRVSPRQESQEETERAKKINYSLLTMNRPWEEYVVEFLSYITYGFHLSEKIYANINTPYGPLVGIKDLVTISQDTVDKWIYDTSTGELLGVKQNLNNIITDTGRAIIGKEKEIPQKKILHFRHNAKRNNPQGNSPLSYAYIPYKYVMLVQEYELTGVAKDLGGIVHLGIDASYLAKATANPTGPEASVVNELKLQAASLHAGEQAYVLTPLAYDNTGKPLFSFDLKGVDGAGKQYQTDDIIRRYDTQILVSFFADVLKLGNEAHGSFSLAESKTNLLAMGIESHLNNIARTLNHDLIPQLYRLNGWEYNPETSCKFTYGDIEKQDLDVLSKFLQRVTSVGLLRPTEKVENKIRDIAFHLGSFEDEDDVLIATENTSRAGDGMATAGEGTSNSVSDDASIGNMENT
jgi:hypothetical protein